MIPHLFESNATNFDTLGIGALTRTISCNVIEELNGAYELNLAMLVDDPLFEFVQVGNIIVALPNMTDNAQAFVIESVSKVINGEVTVYATHIAQYRTKLIPIPPFAATGVSGVALAFRSLALETNPFTLDTNSTSTATLTDQYPKSMRDIMGGSEGSILDIFGGEYYYDNFTIHHLTHRGRNTDARVMYGRNMTGFEQDETFAWNNSATGVYPYWYSEEEGIRYGDIQYSPYKDLYPYAKTVTVDFTDKFQTKPSKAELEAYALTWITSKGLPSVTLECSFDQFDFTDAQVNTLQLGDTVQVINSMYGVNYMSRIVATDFDVLGENYNTITVGDLKATLSSVIGEASQGESSVSNVVYYGTCSTAAATAAKTTNIANFPESLYTGMRVSVKFDYANGKANPTLSINGGTAVSIKRYGTTAPSTSAASSWNAGAVVDFVYDGTYWQMVAWNNTTYSSMTDAEISAGTGTTARIITPARLKTAIETWAVGKNVCCYANSIVRSFSSGQYTFALSDLKITTGDKPVGILLTPQYGSGVIMKYNYDSSSSSGVIIEAYNHDGTAYSGNLRFFCAVFQNSIT